MLRIIKKRTFAIAIVSLFGLLPSLVGAQGLTISPVEAGPTVGALDYTVIALIALRYVIVTITVFAAAIAVFQGYLWLTHEGNMEKAYAAKESLGRAVIIITVCFIALSIYRIFVEDYSLLQF